MWPRPPTSTAQKWCRWSEITGARHQCLVAIPVGAASPPQGRSLVDLLIDLTRHAKPSVGKARVPLLVDLCAKQRVHSVSPRREFYLGIISRKNSPFNENLQHKQ